MHRPAPPASRQRPVPGARAGLACRLREPLSPDLLLTQASTPQGGWGGRSTWAASRSWSLGCIALFAGFCILHFDIPKREVTSGREGGEGRGRPRGRLQGELPLKLGLRNYG